MDREQSGAWHAVLQASPRGTPERVGSGWEPLVERLDVASVCEDLRPREVDPPRQHPLSVGSVTVSDSPE